MILHKSVEYTIRYLRKTASSDDQLMELKDELKEFLVAIILIRSFEDMSRDRY
jgi:hypothetical protein